MAMQPKDRGKESPTARRNFCLQGGGLLLAGRASAQAKPPEPTEMRAHPRLVFTPALEALLRQRLGRDALLQQFVARMRERSTQIAGQSPVPFKPISPYGNFGIQMLEVSRAILERITVHAFLYRLGGERVYAERTWRELETALAYPTWNPAHYLDAAEMLVAVAFAYDWVFDAWTPAQRATLREAMTVRAIERGIEIHEQRTGPSSFFPTTSANWNSVCNAGLLAATLAMAEDEPALAQRVLALAVPSLARPQNSYEPDGGSDEGPTYWGYGTDFYTLAAAILASATGNDAGLLDSPGIARTTLYRLHVQAPCGRNYTYADGWPDGDASLAYAMLAQRFGPPAARAHLRGLLADTVAAPGKSLRGRLNPLIALFLPPEQPAGALAGVPLDAFFGGVAHLAMMRSAWGDPRAAYVGFKAGQAEHSHNHLDLGSFVFDHGGLRWSTDLGPERYTLPDYFSKTGQPGRPSRWSYLRANNFGHSTLTLGGDLQAAQSYAPMVARHSAPRLAFAVADLGAVYPARASGWQRGVALVERGWLAVRDELRGLQSGCAVEWVLMTEAQVSLAADGRSASLSQGGQTVQLTLAEAPSAARITSAPARPLTAAETQNDGVTRLTVRWNGGAPDESLEVHLVPASFSGRAVPQGKLADWTLRT